MKTILSFFILFALGTAGKAQNYNFSTFTEPYTPILNGTAAVNQSWDDPELFISLGFETTVFGVPSTAIAASGEFLGGIVATNSNLESLNVILATTADLIDPNYFNGVEVTSPITYITEGEPGDRIFKLQWENAGFYDDVVEGSGANLINLQLWIYESGRIEVRHGPNSIKEPGVVLANGWTSGLMRGLNVFSEEFTFDQAFVVSGSPSDPAYNELTDAFQLFVTSLNGVPSNGRVYRFDPEEEVSVNEIYNEIEFKAWPLSTQNDLQVSVSHPSVSRYEVRDLSGKLVAEQQFNEISRVSLAEQATGIYLLTVYTASEFKTFKVVKY